jgi:uncharacterized membrane protein YcjF (UPF0283 family)
MDHSFKTILRAFFLTTIAMVWFAVVMGICLLIPSTRLLEIFLVMIGSIILAIGVVILAREVSKLVDLRHWQRMRQQLRELELREREQEQLLLTIRPRRSSRGRYL